MTSPTTPGSAQQDLEGRSVRDVVEYSPGQVNDAWCRKIFRKILQSLELQYAMHMPHRVITPDTIVFHANGEPLLISDDIDAAPAEDARQADDLTALARVLHYAITQELAPTGPLVGRADGYSAALIATVDACMDPDPTRRPPCVDAVRNLLGIAASAPPAGAVTMPEVQVPPGPRLDAPIVTEASGAGMVAAPKVPTAAIGSAPTGAADDSAARVPGAPVVSSLPSSASTLQQLPSAPVLAAASAPRTRRTQASKRIMRVCTEAGDGPSQLVAAQSQSRLPCCCRPNCAIPAHASVWRRRHRRPLVRLSACQRRSPAPPPQGLWQRVHRRTKSPTLRQTIRATPPQPWQRPTQPAARLAAWQGARTLA